MSGSSNLRTRFLICAFIFLATFAVYFKATGFKFVDYDDTDYVTENYHVETGLSAQNVVWAFASTHACNWHPLTWISHMIDVQLFGMKPMGHHLTNIILHSLNSALLFLVLFTLTGSVWRGAFVAALFALHPMHVESVAWVSERKDVLSAFFWMLTMLAYAGYVRAPSACRYLLVLVAFALGLLAKPMLVTLPLVLLLMDFWPLGRTQGPKGLSWKFLVREKAPLIALTVASCGITYYAQRVGGATGSFQAYGFGSRVANTFLAYTAYIIKLICPRNLCIGYPHPGNNVPVAGAVASVLAFVGVTYLAVRCARKLPYITAGWLWYVVTLIPVIGLVQVGMQGMADRYTYIPAIGLFIIAAWGVPESVSRLIKSPLARAVSLGAIAGSVVVAMGALTWFQLGVWKDSDALFRNALRCTNGHFAVRTLFTQHLLREGKWNEAMEQINKALEMYPNSAEAHNALGFILATRGKTREAVRQYVRALQIDPNFANAHSNLGTAFAKRGMLDEAIACFKHALDADPELLQAHLNLGAAYARLGNSDDAQAEFEKALEIRPSYPEAHGKLGALFFERGQIDEAIKHLKIAVESPTCSADSQLYLGAALFRKGELKPSIEHLTKATKLNPTWGTAHKSLATALLEDGDYKGAAREAELAKKYGDTPGADFYAKLGNR